MKKTYLTAALLSMLLLMLPFCTHDDELMPPKGIPNLEDQVRVQIAFDGTDVAFRFIWKSQSKKFPVNQANVGKNYPGHLHDFMVHDGTRFNRFPSSERMNEDRITFMIDKYNSLIPGFAKVGCAVSCHTGMASHNLPTNEVLDHWHWRGGRSGPMGFAEDAAVDNVERIRDNSGTPPTKFIRSGGDRFREVQAAMSGSIHPVLADGLPRFVFHKGKVMPGNYTIPAYFVVNNNNQIMTNPFAESPEIKDLKNNVSLLVVYQDRTFDPEEKVNALDLGYLVWVATNEISHLPSHLQNPSSDDFTTWKSYWEMQTNVTTVGTALMILDQVHNEWLTSNRKAMVTRSVGFIYNSDQHDIRSEASYDDARQEWTVVLRRKLNTGSNRDTDLSGLANGQKYSMSFAMHDAGGAGITHDISMPLVLSNSADEDLVATPVNSLENVNWKEVPPYDTYWVRQNAIPHFYYDWLKSGNHPGSAVLETTPCGNCHNQNNASLLTSTVLK